MVTSEILIVRRDRRGSHGRFGDPKCIECGNRAQDGIADGVVGDGEVVNRDDLSDADHIEDANWTDATQAHIANAVAVDDDVD